MLDTDGSTLRMLSDLSEQHAKLKHGAQSENPPNKAAKQQAKITPMIIIRLVKQLCVAVSLLQTADALSE